MKIIPEKQLEARIDAPPPLDPQAYTILVVDDNPTNLGVISDYLADRGFQTLAARTGISGLKKAAYVRPDLILLDVMMPGIDGFETCRQLKANEETREIPVIFMTALSEAEDKVKGFRAGAVDYVTKPLQQEEVLARVTTHLRIRDLAQSLQEKNKRLQQMTEELTELNASKDKFFSIVAHDLQGPFQPLLGSTEFLARHGHRLDPEEVKETGTEIYRSARTVFAFLENLLQWSRIQRGRLESLPVTIDLNEVIDNNVKLLEHNAANKEIELRNGLTERLAVHADKNMLNTVIRNLITNALKFTPAGGQVTVSARPADAVPEGEAAETQFVEISVADTGIGISPENIRKLFRIDVHHTTQGTDQEPGTGLGLIICQEMVEKNGGQIWIESEVGQGTAVKFTVPVEEKMDVALRLSRL